MNERSLVQPGLCQQRGDARFRRMAGNQDKTPLLRRGLDTDAAQSVEMLLNGVAPGICWRWIRVTKGFSPHYEIGRAHV